ncbi:MAG: hypothetical protein HND53_10535 [Proteobacteria bacterium]|nr:hypothetical protein [Pseudomonadota bacterium]NOG60928.1 hypothetical protein [Pseudomonadota bacterium]
MKSLIFVLSILMLTSTSVFAVDINGNYAVWGVGKKSCFGFNKEINGEDSDKYKHYIKGFLTAYNIFTEKTYSITGSMNENDVLEWLNEYCADNPMSGLETALLSFTFDHYDKRMKASGTAAGR